MTEAQATVTPAVAVPATAVPAKQNITHRNSGMPEFLTDSDVSEEHGRHGHD